MYPCRTAHPARRAPWGLIQELLSVECIDIQNLILFKIICRYVAGARVAGAGAYGIRMGVSKRGQTALEYVLDLPVEAADSEVCAGWPRCFGYCSCRVWRGVMHHILVSWCSCLPRGTLLHTGTDRNFKVCERCLCWPSD